MPLIRKPEKLPAAPAIDAASTFAALRSGSVDERWAAARAASQWPGGVAALAAALRDERDSHVREAILTALAGSHSEEGIDALLPLLRSDDAPVRTGALDALRTIREAIAPHLPRLLHDADPDVRILACELARNLRDDDAARMLCELLDAESEPNVCAAAVEVLADVGGPASLPSLARCAERFRGAPFLDYSISATIERIRSPSNRPRE
jgi:HEAT repeat protein